MPASLPWLADFLPKLCCPVTHEALRLATAEELALAGQSTESLALITLSGTRLYPVVEGIPHLLPDSAILVQPSPSSAATTASARV